MNSLQFMVDRKGAQAIISGPDELLRFVEDTLHAWAVQLPARGASPTEAIVPYIKEEGRIRVALGALLCIAGSIELDMPGPAEAFVARVSGSCAALLDGGLLWKHQAEAVEAALSARFGRGVIKVPTGGGKTRIAIGIIVVGASLGLDGWSYVVHNEELAKQTEQEFAILGPQMGACLGYEGPPLCHFSSYGGVNNTMLRHGQGLILDECHGAVASTRAAAIAPCRATWRIGLSATPTDRADGKNPLVLGTIGPIIYEISLTLLEKLGRIAKAKVTVLRMCAM